MTHQAAQYNLNQGQQAAADAFFEFLLGDGKEFIISGPAGVGKTYLMNYIIDQTMPQYHNMCKLIDIEPKFNDVVMTATTNKAAEVLSKATGRPTTTIHSELALKVREDYSTGKTTLIRRNDWMPKYNKIIFIDECSMIDTALYKEIQDATINCKLVYVGDHNQLAPVFETLSPVYKHNAPMYTLTEQMRNRGQPALMHICQQLRNTVETGVFNPIQIIPGVIDYLEGNMMAMALDSTFKTQNLEARVLAYTNHRVIEYNDHIRTIRNLPDSYQPGEILVNTSAIELGKNRMLPVEGEVTVDRNHGPDQIKVQDGVMMDVEYLDLKSLYGSYNNIPIATNRKHFTDLCKYYARVKNWERHFYLKKTFPDLRPRDAATVHKSQGSTYDTVFIDLGNISTNHKKDEVARLLYVAFSRARNRVVLYGQLADKYGGLII